MLTSIRLKSIVLSLLLMSLPLAALLYPQLPQQVEGQTMIDSEAPLHPLVSGGTPSVSNATALNPHQITLLNWNIYKGQRRDWAVDLQRFSQHYDLVTIQEAHLSDELQQLLYGNQHHWVMNTAFTLRQRGTGVMTASAVRPVVSTGLRFREPLLRLPKTILITHYPLAGMGEQLLVANIHAINFTLGTRGYAQQLARLAELLAAHQGPLILAGDFNSWSRARMEVVDAMVAKLGLDAAGRDHPHKSRLFGNPIDHVYFRGLQLVEQRVWPVGSSDHNPMQVHFRVS